jgi:3-oxoacyl-[acyl-carrier-protein] synthase II
MNTEFREVVLTGMGAVSPFGVGAGALWEGVSRGQSGINWIRSLGELAPENYPVCYAGEVTNFNADRLLKKHCEVRLEKSVQMALVAAQEALEQAGLLTDGNTSETERTPSP